MTGKEALKHYQTIKGIPHDPWPSNIELPKVRDSLSALMCIDEMARNAGSELKSRQIMAAIIYFSELRHIPQL